MIIRSQLKWFCSKFHRNQSNSYIFDVGLRFFLNWSHDLNRLGKLDWCLSYYSIFVSEFHEAEVSVPPDLHEIDVEYLELRRHHCEVDELQQRPHFEVCFHCGHKFLTKLIFGSLERLALALGCEDVEAGNRHQAEESLSKQQFLSKWCHRISRGEEWDEFRIGVVKSGAVGKKAIRHEVHSTTVVVLCLGFIYGCTKVKLESKFERKNRRHHCDTLIL